MTWARSSGTGRGVPAGSTTEYPHGLVGKARRKRGKVRGCSSPIARKFGKLRRVCGKVREGDKSGRRDLNPRPSAWEADTLPLSYSRLSASGTIQKFLMPVNCCCLVGQSFRSDTVTVQGMIDHRDHRLNCQVSLEKALDLLHLFPGMIEEPPMLARTALPCVAGPVATPGSSARVA